MRQVFLIFIMLGVFTLSVFLAGRLYFSLREPDPVPTITLTIPEGSTVMQINEKLKEEGVLVNEKLSEELEGYLFPDTYEFFIPSGVDVVAEKFRENFQLKAIRIISDLNTENEISDAIIMASLIEREVPDSRDRRIISGILWKRIEAGIPLQVDATICYRKEDPCLPITKEDKNRDSLYNTYLYLGLPPGPISNPGEDAIEASVNPEESAYWYYISDAGSNDTIFAETLDEHNQNVVKYLSE